jgi:hypothetical protein
MPNGGVAMIHNLMRLPYLNGRLGDFMDRSYRWRLRLVCDVEEEGGAFAFIQRAQHGLTSQLD